MRGVPTWATLIALVQKQSDGSEVVTTGVVSAPALFRRWYASTGTGAFVIVNGDKPKRISVSQVAKVEDASISYSDLIGWGNRLAQSEALFFSGEVKDASIDPGGVYSVLLLCAGQT